jgi:hypothetical protein
MLANIQAEQANWEHACENADELDRSRDLAAAHHREVLTQYYHAAVVQGNKLERDLSQIFSGST